MNTPTVHLHRPGEEIPVKPANHTRVIAVSDTHGNHRQLQLPPGDLLIHAGDLCGHGTFRELHNVMEWFKELLEAGQFKEICFTPGNHDWPFERDLASAMGMLPAGCWVVLRSGPQDSEGRRSPEGRLQGISLWGAPHTPEFHRWAFNIQREHLWRIWEDMPENIDLLISHGPPAGYLDTTIKGQRVGDQGLLEAIERRQITTIICGHIHEAAGMRQMAGGTTCINASTLDAKYRPTGQCWILDFPLSDKSL